MIRETSIYKVVVCSVCGHVLVYRPAVQAKPEICPACRAGPDVGMGNYGFPVSPYGGSPYGNATN